ncbi:hypothetical protein HCN44_009267 [Aphidius gifuensis]|uniref:Adhesion G protein-coupled receptor A3 n=1 Tax=Aphidius gifuensis TaxID=684658 RepID=A0A834Y5Z8_APHGI|nr:adhesion G protein-coupled receptor A3 [Aphidius gifuensis]KAF7997869.1 hypothetical protein HCN44_009267 [Aphidius gifuensis]
MKKLLILLILIQVLGPSFVNACPAPCSCKNTGQQSDKIRVKCNKDIQDIKQIGFNIIAPDIYGLDLSKNVIDVVEPYVFQNLTNLRRLNLAYNKISKLEKDCFFGLQNLERLNISNNQISSIDSMVFSQLLNLKKLSLSFNKISTVETDLFHNLLAIDQLELNGNALKTLSERSFHVLRELRLVDLSDNPWECDCRLYWLSNWNSSLYKLNPFPKCHSPQNFQGHYITELGLSADYSCQFTKPVVEIKPDQNQVVFEGDTITLKCSVPSIPNDPSANLNWLWDPTMNIDNNINNEKNLINPLEKFSNIKIENRRLSDNAIIDISLKIDPVKEEHNGKWNCHLLSNFGNISTAISIIVISDKTRYCPLTITTNNKGVYAWPKTVIGWKVELPCEGFALVPLRASYECDENGNWKNLNTELCPFTSSITKSFEQFSKVDLTLTKSTFLETAKRFKNHTSDVNKITDPIEIHFIVKTIENYLKYLTYEKELDILLINIISIIMKVPRLILKTAEKNYKACTRLIKSIENINEHKNSNILNNKNIALETIRIKQEYTYSSLSCTWYSYNQLIEKNDSRILNCLENNKTINNFYIDNKIIEATIQLKFNFTKIETFNLTTTPQLMISMFSDNNLFPFYTDNKTYEKYDITSGIIGSNIIGLNNNITKNLTEPIIVILKMLNPYDSNKRPILAIWNINNNGSGEWSTKGCELKEALATLVLYHCDKLGYYGLLEDLSYLDEKPMIIGAKFKYSNPAIYIGTLIIIICLTCTSVTYIICNTSIAMPKRSKHSIINTWIAIILLCFFYTTGIQQTEDIEICQNVGLALHYLSLCCLLWMTVSAHIMYHRLSKSNIKTIPDDEIPEQTMPKPILGLYLCGWGISMIICGISSAINHHEYYGYNYCFLSTGPAIVQLFIPSIILIIYMMILYLLIRCTIRNINNNNGQLSEGTQATENVDLELLEPNENRVDDNSVNSTPTVSSEIEDIEHSQITQLKGHIIILILFIIIWLSGCITTIQPFTNYLPNEELIFASIYALSSCGLGLFVLLFYGIARSDVRSQWTIMRCWLKRKKNNCCRTRNVCDAHQTIPAQPLVQNLTLPILNTQATQVTSDTNSIASSRCYIDTSMRVSNIQLKTSDIGSDTTLSINKNQNINLVVLHRQQYRSNNSVTTYTESAVAGGHSTCAEMFYNPHQSGVARKFFKKQRRHIKHNNLGPRKQGDGGATSDNDSCISIPRPAQRNHDNQHLNNSKVNNTNIHVEINPVSDVKNINILSDSCGSISSIGDNNIPVRYVIGQEKIHINGKKLNNNNNLSNKNNIQQNIPLSPIESDGDTKTEEEKLLKNASQQCSLEYSSEIDSVTQITSEKSDNNLPEIDETPETSDKKIDIDFKCTSLNQINHNNNNNNNKNSKILLKRCEQSNSLSCLTNINHYNIENIQKNYRNSYNDLLSIDTSSKNCEADSRASIDDLISEENSDINSRHYIESQQSETDENSFTSETLFNRDAPLFTTSLNNIKRISSNSENINFDILHELKLPNLNQQVNNIINHDNNNHDYLVKEFNSLTDLTAINVSLGEIRHLDINASIGVDYEDTNYTDTQIYNEDFVVDDDDDDNNVILLDENSDKKETSV